MGLSAAGKRFNYGNFCGPLRNWLLRPSIDTGEIVARLDAVAECVPSPMLLEEVRTSFEGIFDLERLLSKITVGTASPRELTALRSSLFTALLLQNVRYAIRTGGSTLTNSSERSCIEYRVVLR